MGKSCKDGAPRNERIIEKSRDISIRLSGQCSPYSSSYTGKYGVVLIGKVNGSTHWRTSFGTKANSFYCLIMKDTEINKLKQSGDRGQCHGTLARLVGGK